MDNVPSDGRLGSEAQLSNAEIAAGADWDGDPDALVSALTASGYIDVVEDVRYLHQWREYAGKLIERREANKQRMRDIRAEHVQDTCDARAPATVQDPTQHNTTQHDHDSPSPSAPSNGREKTASKAKPSEPREDQQMFSVWCREMQIDSDTVTDSARGEINNMIRQLRKVGATHVDIPFLIGTYMRKFPKMKISPSAIAKHYHELRPQQVKYVPADPSPDDGGEDAHCPICGAFVDECDCPVDKLRELKAACIAHGRDDYAVPLAVYQGIQRDHGGDPFKWLEAAQ